MNRYFIALVSLIWSLNIHAQVKVSTVSSTGSATLKGQLTDKENFNAALPFANVLVKGTSIGTTTDLDGRFSLSIPEGEHIIQFSFIGYEVLEQAIIVTSGQVLEIEQALGASSVALEDVTVTAKVNRNTENAAMLEQQNSVSIVQAISSKELSRKGVSDAEGAVTKVSGISKQDGVKNVFVRGLGDRYNATTLNGFPLPSEDPEYKNISLDFFSSNVIQSVGVNKVFTSGMNGDVGGANIDVSSKKLSENREFRISAGTGVNTQTVGQEFRKLDGVSGFGIVRHPEANVRDLSLYTFQNSMQPSTQNFQMDQSYSVSGGKKWNLGEKMNPLSFFITGAFTSDYSFIEGDLRQTTTDGTIYRDQEYDKFSQDISHMLMGSIDFAFNGHQLAYNGLLIHSNKQYVGDYQGFNTPEDDGDLEFLRRQQVNDNLLIVHQLETEWTLADRWTFDAGGAYNFVQGNEPDRRSNKYLIRDGIISPSTNSPGENERFYSELLENDFMGKLSTTYKFKEEEDNASRITLGYDGRYTVRNFEAISYNHDFATQIPIDVDDPNAVDQLFSQDGLDRGHFKLVTGRGNANNPRVLDPFTYDMQRAVNGFYGDFVWQFGEDFILNAGLRFDDVLMEVEYDTNLASSDFDGVSQIDELFWMPSLNLKYDFSDKHALRFGASRTYTLPQAKEIAPFKYQDVAFSSQGNPDLIPSINYNFDLKWDYYLGLGEILSVTGFYKLVEDPISRVEVASAGNTLTYLNISDRANIAGAELEFRKNLFKRFDEGGAMSKLAFGLNASYLYTYVDLGGEESTFTNTSSNLEGAAPFLMNLDLSYSLRNDAIDWMLSAVMNYFSERVYSIGTQGFENIEEKGIPTLDLVTSLKFARHWGLGLKARNLLNPNYQLKRLPTASGMDAVVLDSYRKGLDFSLSLSYQL